MIDIKQEYLLPQPFRMVGIALLGLGIILFAQQVVQLVANGTPTWVMLVGIALALLGAIIATVHYRLRVDVEDKWLNVYVWLLGFKIGEPEVFNQVESVYINKVLQSRRVSSFTGHQSEVKEYLYKAFMKLDTGQKVHLDTDKNEQKLIDRVTTYNDYLKPQLINY